jgi:hypothetical protein
MAADTGTSKEASVRTRKRSLLTVGFLLAGSVVHLGLLLSLSGSATASTAPRAETECEAPFYGGGCPVPGPGPGVESGDRVTPVVPASEAVQDRRPVQRQRIARTGSRTRSDVLVGVSFVVVGGVLVLFAERPRRRYLPRHLHHPAFLLLPHLERQPRDLT